MCLSKLNNYYILIIKYIPHFNILSSEIKVDINKIIKI